MKIDRIEQFHIRMPLKHPFETSFGRAELLDKIIIAVYADGLVGYGECPVDDGPFYSYESIDTCWNIQRDHLFPMLLKTEFDVSSDLPRIFAPVRGHNFAKAGVESAVWDLEAKQKGMSLKELVGATRDRVRVRVSVGIQATSEELRERVASFLEKGYTQIKIKIKPGKDIVLVETLRAAFPDLELMVDANSAYSLNDADMLRQLDTYNLVMIEQPLAYDDLIDHAALQNEINTPICLDESISSPARARDAIALGSAQIINIKPGRVGGPSNSIAIHNHCQANDIPVWCGGMLESGIGRAHNLALAALPNFQFPSDISATDRYWNEDIVDHQFTINADGTMTVPDGLGIGVEVSRKVLDKYLVWKAVYPLSTVERQMFVF